MLTLNLMHTMWPHGNNKVSGLIEAMVAAAPTIFPKYGIAGNLIIAHAMAQFSHECGAGLDMVENINYTPKRACEIWPSRFDSEDDCLTKVGSSAGDSEFRTKLIDNVYGNRMGNRQGTHDGSRFIGRGLSQTTGRDGYQRLGAKIGINLVDNPDLVTASTNVLECGVADFVLCGCLPFAQADDVQGVTKHLNGGFIGLSQRSAWLTRWKTALGAKNPPIHSTTWLQVSLNKLGADPLLIADGMFGPMTANAVKEFQAVHNLNTDGKLDPQTLVAIDKALAEA